MAIVRPSDIGNRQYEVQEDNLQFFAAKMSVVVVGDSESKHQICQIVFGKKDGSIYLSTPYFGAGHGVVTNAAIGNGPPYKISLADRGKVTSHLVKLAHHPDGEVHFSQKGKVKTEIRRTSFPLSTSIGHIFQLHIYYPRAFARISFAEQKTKRAYLWHQFRHGLPMALSITGEWRRKDALKANTDPPGGTIRPVTTVRHRRTGDESLVTLVGQPAAWPLTDHVLTLSCAPTTPLANVTDKTMILLAGWDPHEITDSRASVQHTGCLAWFYPHDNPAELAAKIGSIDWEPPRLAV